MAGRPKSLRQAHFFDELNDWSEIKLRILVKYFDAYRRYRGGSNPTIYYIDGFAGAGWYGKDACNLKEGSPIRLARLAQEISDSGKPYRLICIYVEIFPNWYETLRKALGGFDPTLVETHLGSFEKHLPAILHKIGGSPAVFFLDPFGPSPVSLSNLTQLLRRPDTELLLNLNTASLRRMAGFEDSTPTRQRAAKLRRVSEILGYSPDEANPEWLQQYRQMDGVDWEGWAATKYIEQLGQMSPYIRYTVAYPIREEYRSNPKYYLVFATRSDEAVVVMNDLVCTEEDDLFMKSEAITSGGQFTLFGPLRESEQERRLDELLDEIHSYGTAHQGCSRDDLINHFVHERFGQFKRKHYRQAVARLVELGRAKYMGDRQNDGTRITFL